MSRRNRKRRKQQQPNRTNGHVNGDVATMEPPKKNEDDVIERAIQQASRQDRDPIGSNLVSLWHSTVKWVRKMDQMPVFDDCFALDKWCVERLHEEPYLAGFVSKAVSAQANRGWALYGGRRITQNTARMLHRFDPTTVRFADGRCYVDDLKSAGWRRASKRKSLSYLTRNAGTFVEIQYRLEPRFTRQGWRLSQVLNLYNMDSARVYWEGNGLYPISYDGSDAWPDPSFYHIVAMPLDVQEKYHIGLSPLYRCIRLAILMTEISDWEMGTLSDDFIDSILLLNGTDADEFNEAMRIREHVVTGGKNKAKRSAVLGNIEPDVDLRGELIKLRSMPESLTDFESRIFLLLQGYAVNLGYSLANFVDSPFSSLLGRSGAETNFLQRATNEAGGNDYHREDEEMMNNLVVPAGVQFNYDPQGDDEHHTAEIANIRSDSLVNLYEASNANGETLGTTEQFRELGVEWGLFHPDWTIQEDDTQTDHEEQTRIMDTEAINRFIVGVESGRWPDDAIVRYHYSPKTNRARIRTVVRSVQELLDNKQRYYDMRLAIPDKQRATEAERTAALELMRRQLEGSQAIAEMIVDE